MGGVIMSKLLVTPERLELSPLAAVLDKAYALLVAGHAREAFRRLAPELTRALVRAEADGARTAFISSVRQHAVFGLLQEDPYTRRAYEKPRGYAGDAVMLDYVYRSDQAETISTSATGKLIFRETTSGPTGLSVLFRRDLLAAHINWALMHRRGARILSVASGHCREVERTRISEFVGECELVALDQDSESCDVVERDYGHLGVLPVAKSLKHLLAGEVALGTFDLIYSAGLFDYLGDRVATALAAKLVALIRPGGRLVIGNYIPNFYGRGYLEAVMDWRLITRTGAELANIIGAKGNESLHSFVDPHGNVVYAVHS
jgi:hypothetical protein